jgi:nucleoside-diphosphate-sugar epimerase
VTGASGFVGRPTVQSLSASGEVHGVVHRSPVPGAASVVSIDDMGGSVPWELITRGMDVVVHLAGRVHMKSSGPAARAAFDRVNVEGTRRLAMGAAAAGVRRFVFVSSVKVHGDVSADAPFEPSSPFRPVDLYGRSKAEAEETLREIEARTDLEVTVVRPPLVYGPGVRANFLSLVRAVDCGIPLPFARVNNRRSFVYVRNLADLLVRAATSPRAAGQSYLATDGPPLSTPTLVRSIARALDRPARLFPVPPTALRLAGRLVGRSAAVDRLLGSLEVDGSAALDRLGWTPSFSMKQGLDATVAWFRRPGAA